METDHPGELHGRGLAVRAYEIKNKNLLCGLSGQLYAKISRYMVS